MTGCNIARTPANTGLKLSASGPPVSDLTLYCSLAGALQYVTITRPSISYSLQQACMFMHDPLSLISIISNASFAILRAPLNTVFTSTLHLLLPRQHTRMPTGLVAQILIVQPLDTVSIWVIISSPGHQNGRSLFHVLQLRTSTDLLHMSG